MSADTSAVATMVRRHDGQHEFRPSADYRRAGVTAFVLGRDAVEARRRFETKCAEIARSVEPTPMVRFAPGSRAVHPLDRPNALVARPDRDGWTVMRGEEVVAVGLPPFRALAMVRQAGGVVERSFEEA